MSFADQDTVVIGEKGFVGAAVIGRAGCLGLSRNDVDLLASDASLAGSVNGRAVIFAASVVPVREEGDETFRANLSLLASLLDADPSFVCYLSTDALYPHDVTVTEKVKPAPITPYAKMHLQREQVLKDRFADRLLILRMSQLYGAADPHSAYGPMRMLRQARAGRAIELFGDGEERRDHMHVDDAADAIVALVRARHSGLLNLATGTSATFAEVARIVTQQLPGSIKRLPRRQPVSHRDIDVSALRLALPEFRTCTLADGLWKTIQGM